MQETRQKGEMSLSPQGNESGKMTGYLFKEPTLYDYWKITSQEIFLAPDNKNKQQAFRSGVNLIRGFNDDTFRYMGDKGNLTGLALQDYEEGKTGEEVMDERNGFKTDFYDELLKKMKKGAKEKEKYEEYW